MGIIVHNFFLDKKDLKKLAEDEITDEITIGQEGKPTSLQDVDNFLGIMNNVYGELHEGIEEIKTEENGTHIALCWSS